MKRKNVQKGQIRVISTKSQNKIYHMDGCPYISRIKKPNRKIIENKKELKKGCHPCKYCNTMHFIYQKESKDMKQYADSRGFTFHMENGEIFIKTEVGLWKIIYLKSREQFMLYHGNKMYEELSVEQACKACFHKQKDRLFYDDIMSVLEYIYKHDDYKKRVLGASEKGIGEMRVSIDPAYEKQRKKRLRRKQLNNMRTIFDKLEKEHPEYRELSIYGYSPKTAD